VDGGGVICACADAPKTTNIKAATINVAESVDLMTNPKALNPKGTKS
jgi:hypothetical protein